MERMLDTCFHDAGNVIAARSINSPELIFDLEFIIEATKIEMNKMKSPGQVPLLTVFLMNMQHIVCQGVQT